MDDQQRGHLEALRRIHQDRLRKLEQQAAAFGLYAPPHVLTEIDAERAEIARIDGELAQAVAAGPPIAEASAARPQALPIAPTPLIGREQAVTKLADLLRQADPRLVTLTGPGGIGKTRLAMQVAANVASDFADGVCFVALAAIVDPALVTATIAQALGLRDVAGQPLAERLANYLRDRRMLLLLDNFEQVIAAAPLVSQLLAAAPALKALVTSRAVLRVTGEHEFVVQPLGLPHPRQTPRAAEIADIPAVHLFAERARAARPDFTLTDQNAGVVAAICARLDGLPLAIELAAARVRLLAPQALLDRLDSRLKLLTSGARDLPTRQQTLRGAIDWSYNLLDPGAQALFAWLAVFAGGFTLDAAEAICGSQELRIEDRGSKIADSSSILYPLSSILDGLGTLVENSLLRQVDGMDGESRFAMLETLREYARERLAEQADERALRQRHAAYYLALAERAEPETLGISQAVSLGYLEDEHDNLRAALSWVIEQRATETALRFGAALERFWWVHGHLSEGRRWLSVVLALPGQAGDDTQAEKVARAWSLRGAGRLAHMQGDYEQANACYAASLALQRELADKAGIAAVLSGQGHVALRLGDYRTARLRFEESLAIQRELGSQRGIADALGNLASVARLQGDHAQAGSLGAERLALVRDLGNRRDLALALANIGHVAIEQGDYERAKSCYKQSLPIFRELNERGNIAILLGNLGVVARGQGDAQLAKQRCTESLALFRELGDRRGAAIALGYLGDTLLSEHHVAGARAYYTESLEIYRSLNERLGIADRLESMAAVCVAAGDHERAARLWGAAEALRADIGTPLWPANRAGYDRAVAEARAQLGEEPFAAAWAAGRALRLEQVIAEALE